jgi:hypothetical protein
MLIKLAAVAASIVLALSGSGVHHHRLHHCHHNCPPITCGPMNNCPPCQGVLCKP